MKWLEPHAGDAEAGKIVQPLRETAKVANAVTIGVNVFLDIETINDGVLVPEVINGGARPVVAHGAAFPFSAWL
jgi:hypothetical protein